MKLNQFLESDPSLQKNLKNRDFFNDARLVFGYLMESAKESSTKSYMNLTNYLHINDDVKKLGSGSNQYISAILYALTKYCYSEQLPCLCSLVRGNGGKPGLGFDKAMENFGIETNYFNESKKCAEYDWDSINWK